MTDGNMEGAVWKTYKLMPGCKDLIIEKFTAHIAGSRRLFKTSSGSAAHLSGFWKNSNNFYEWNLICTNN